ncbi:S-layer homology domain-containing protein [Intestinimonas butyriciproducens]|uniref:S-layer homology domain-containing protein n=1 Tax=Intestinimonas butyriciproducens TaxID=1297617 RepID=UPI00189CCC4D|nr:S-layer homology domain-containing protein [Intestinimonas butyriciproducens]MDB7817637.1 S-layer homology domain-containing protein [Intestinimonas butyriciproducens]MDB7844338.1 S-layer homology domain-containing protein [Intestinimonas butyriciproducens]MDB7858819.1 S-layer homology domain-containing protein [Intestinimonas butyriciproducens]
MIGVKAMNILSGLLAMSVMLSACAAPPPSIETDTTTMIQTQVFTDSLNTVKTGFITEQILAGADGDIHYSYYLPEGYDETRNYPLMMTMPGYDMMWFGEQSSGSNLGWTGFRSWTELDEDMIVVSAQLTDWGEKSVRQAIELTEYFIRNFAVDENRVYAAGYSAGGETMSRAISMRPDLYTAYLHGASQWDGTFEPVAENRVAVYIFMAENDEYYGSQKARSAYNGLHDAYEDVGLRDEQIDQLLQLEIPDNAYFNALGIHGNYHGGGNVLFDDEQILNWILSARRPEGDRVENAGFSDENAIAAYALNTVEWARANGIVNGKSGNRFDPKGNATRAEVATILRNYMETQ